ncbi:MAG: hypothetical protein KAW87_05580 [Candidatus Cloacimonetes bacterium]|nr:hypothetical protein [Candidatus Cloacimonadota bacterium]
MSKKFLYYSLVIGLLGLEMLTVGCNKSSKYQAKQKEKSPFRTKELQKPISPMTESQIYIEIKAEGKILHYQRETFLNEEDFSEILKSKEKFQSKKIDDFKKILKRYNRQVVNPDMEFDEARKSIIFICDITGAKEGNWFDFDWFLRPLSLDFLDNHFERREKELFWEGKVDSKMTRISIKFPFYISNCHEHVWPKYK